MEVLLHSSKLLNSTNNRSTRFLVLSEQTQKVGLLSPSVPLPRPVPLPRESRYLGKFCSFLCPHVAPLEIGWMGFQEIFAAIDRLIPIFVKIGELFLKLHEDLAFLRLQKEIYCNVDGHRVARWLTLKHLSTEYTQGNNGTAALSTRSAPWPFLREASVNTF